MKFLALIIASVAAVNTDRVEGVKVDAKNWPGVILAGDRAILPQPSSAVDDDFNPLFNRFRYA